VHFIIKAMKNILLKLSVSSTTLKSIRLVPQVAKLTSVAGADNIFKATTKDGSKAKEEGHPNTKDHKDKVGKGTLTAVSRADKVPQDIPFSGANGDGQIAMDTKFISAAKRQNKVNRVFNSILHLSVLELTELLTKMKTTFGYDPTMFVSSQSIPAQSGQAPAHGSAPATATAPATAASTQVEFTVKLEKYDEAKKINVIKEVRAITGLGLKEAKDLVTEAPKVVKKGLKKEDAEKIAEQIKAAGGTVTVL